MRIAKRSLLVAAIGLLSFPCHCCTLCDSSEAGEVRAGVLDGNFLETIAAVLSPLAACLALARPAARLASGRITPRKAP